MSPISWFMENTFKSFKSLIFTILFFQIFLYIILYTNYKHAIVHLAMTRLKPEYTNGLGRPFNVGWDPDEVPRFVCPEWM